MADRKKAKAISATTNPEPIVPKGYADFLAGIKQQIRQRQYRALRAVNHELVALYWELGESICRKQEEHGWGRSVVENLARDLQAEFPGRNGFSPQNMWLMRQFYLEYHDKPILAPLVREISWAKNRVILGRCKDDLAREFYLRAAARFGWTKAVLQHQIDNQSYEKYLLGQTNSLLAWTARIVAVAAGEAAPLYRPGSIDASFLSHLVQLSSYDEGPLLAKQFLHRNGIRLVVEPHLRGTRLDGAAIMTAWITSGSLCSMNWGTWPGTRTSPALRFWPGRCACTRRWSRGGSERNAATIDCCRKWRTRRGSGRCGGWRRDIREKRRRLDG